MVTAIIPIKSESKRLPGKNFLDFADTSLFLNKLHQLLRIDQITEIIVSSDNYKFLDDIISKGFNKVKVDYRPSKFSDDNEPFYLFLEYLSELSSNNHIAWTPITSPCLSSENIEKAINHYLEYVDINFDSLITVTRLEEYLLFNGKPVNFTTSKNRKPTNFTSPIYRITNGLIICPTSKIKKWKDHYGPKVFLYELSKVESVDIDTMEDYISALAYHSYFGCR